MRNAHKILGGIPDNLGVNGNNIKMNLTEVGWDGVEWIDLPLDTDHWDAVENTIIDLWVP